MTAIGVFDSGVGGLTVVKALKRRLPSESILFLGDTARLPYGTKSPQTVTSYTRKNVDFLRQRGVKAIVVACNTASALALDSLDLPLPIWGVVEPGARLSAKTAERHVAVLGTESTIESQAYPRAIRRLRDDLEISSVACPLFVPLVEEGWQSDPVAEEVARRYLEPLLVGSDNERDANRAGPRVDTMVLGCTHYPLLEPVLRRVAGDGVQFVDSAASTATYVATELERLGLAETAGPTEDHFCVTDSARRFERIAGLILERDGVRLEHVDI